MKKYRDINAGHTQVMSTLNPFQLMEFALQHLGQAISTAEGFSVQLCTGPNTPGMTLTAHHVDTCDNKTGSVSENVIARLSIDADTLDDNLMWEQYQERHRRHE